MPKPPILKAKFYNHEPVFKPENLLRESRRQNNLDHCDVPDICILDPDGDLVRWLKKENKTRKNNCWACYHSELYNFSIDNLTVGVIPCAVGASYAVLVAEQLFASGCSLLISITSAGIINEQLVERPFALITESIRDEGASYHYLAPDKPASPQASITQALNTDTSSRNQHLYFNAKSWTTDAPYRETQLAIDAMKNQHVVCVEMESSALYAFSQATGHPVICFAHLTNTMAQNEKDFEKGDEFGAPATLNLIKTVIHRISTNSDLLHA